MQGRSGNFLTLEFNRLSPATVTYAVESSPDLTTWTAIATLAVGTDAWTGVAGVAESAPNSLRTATVTDNVNITLQSPAFPAAPGVIAVKSSSRSGVLIDTHTSLAPPLY